MPETVPISAAGFSRSGYAVQAKSPGWQGEAANPGWLRGQAGLSGLRRAFDPMAKIQANSATLPGLVHHPRGPRHRPRRSAPIQAYPRAVQEQQLSAAATPLLIPPRRGRRLGNCAVSARTEIDTPPGGQPDARGSSRNIAAAQAHPTGRSRYRVSDPFRLIEGRVGRVRA